MSILDEFDEEFSFSDLIEAYFDEEYDENEVKAYVPNNVLQTYCTGILAEDPDQYSKLEKLLGKEFITQEISEMTCDEMRELFVVVDPNRLIEVMRGIDLACCLEEFINYDIPLQPVINKIEAECGVGYTKKEIRKISNWTVKSICQNIKLLRQYFLQPDLIAIVATCDSSFDSSALSQLRDFFNLGEIALILCRHGLIEVMFESGVGYEDSMLFHEWLEQERILPILLNIINKDNTYLDNLIKAECCSGDISEEEFIAILRSKGMTI